MNVEGGDSKPLLDVLVILSRIGVDLDDWILQWRGLVLWWFWIWVPNVGIKADVC